MRRSKNAVRTEVTKSAELVMVGSPAYYQNILKNHTHNQKAYDRLINTAIKIFEKLYAPVKSKGKKVNTISNQLNRALGLVDKKGKALHEREPLARWKKRREVVLKKIKAV